ncbi:hypothetical protein V5O48_013197 [Marasmius crinis-equi]|uniref:Uncharacterized protein n=1 Tax=Marasmius crinis-equi TaxID=585013 RepID=A0ABR3F130_9AGAR
MNLNCASKATRHVAWPARSDQNAQKLPSSTWKARAEKAKTINKNRSLRDRSEIPEWRTGIKDALRRFLGVPSAFGLLISTRACWLSPAGPAEATRTKTIELQHVHGILWTRILCTESQHPMAPNTRSSVRQTRSSARPTKPQTKTNGARKPVNPKSKSKRKTVKATEDEEVALEEESEDANVSDAQETAAGPARRQAKKAVETAKTPQTQQKSQRDEISEKPMASISGTTVPPPRPQRAAAKRLVGVIMPPLPEPLRTPKAKRVAPTRTPYHSSAASSGEDEEPPEDQEQDDNARSRPLLTSPPTTPRDRYRLTSPRRTPFQIQPDVNLDQFLLDIEDEHALATIEEEDEGEDEGHFGRIVFDKKDGEDGQDYDGDNDEDDDGDDMVKDGDYAETYAAIQKKRAARGYEPESEEEEESDAEGEISAEEESARKGKRKGKQTRTTQRKNNQGAKKASQKAPAPATKQAPPKAPTTTADADEDNDHEVPVDDSYDGFGDDDHDFIRPSGYKPGPIAEEIHDKAREAWETYRQTIYQLAKDANKSPHEVFAIVNQEQAAKPRKISPWNAWLAHHAVYDEEKKPKDESLADWNTHLRDKYYDILEERILEQGLEPGPGVTREVMAPEIEWFEKRFASYLESQKKSGKFDATVGKILAPFMNLSSHARHNYGVHVFGFFISTTRDSTGRSPNCFWGGSPEFAMMKAKNSTQLSAQLDDCDALLRVIEMDLRDTPVIDQELYRHLAVRQGENARDRDRRLLIWFMSTDTGNLLGESKKFAMDSFPKKAWSSHLVAVNWPEGIPFPGLGVKTFHNLTQTELRAIVGPREDFLLRMMQNEATEDEKEQMDFFHLEKWDDDDIDLDLEAQEKVAIVKDTRCQVVWEAGRAQQMVELIKTAKRNSSTIPTSLPDNDGGGSGAVDGPRRNVKDAEGKGKAKTLPLFDEDEEDAYMSPPPPTRTAKPSADRRAQLLARPPPPPPPRPSRATPTIRAVAGSSSTATRSGPPPVNRGSRPPSRASSVAPDDRNATSRVPMRDYDNVLERAQASLNRARAQAAETERAKFKRSLRLVEEEEGEQVEPDPKRQRLEDERAYQDEGAGDEDEEEELEAQRHPVSQPRVIRPLPQRKHAHISTLYHPSA